MNDPGQLPLRDIHLPDAVSWWPPAVGWWLLPLAVVLVVAGVWWWLRANAPRRRVNSLRKIAHAEFGRLEAEYLRNQDADRLLQDLSVLLRRVAMTFSPRAGVAGLSSASWVDWLKSTDAARAFDARSLELLVDGPYRRNPGRGDVGQLVGKCRRWLDAFDPGRI